MTLEADLLLDRRRLKRRINLWRIVAVLGVVAAISAVIPASVLPSGGHYVARLDVRGTITDDRRVIEAIDAVAADETVRALIVAIDSPGGTVAGGESLHAAIARVAARKPVVATMGATAASAGYMVALPAARIFARESTLTGSIGVMLQTFEATDLLARLGVRPEVITSGPLKGQPSPFAPLTPEGRAALGDVVQDMHGQFVRMVAAARQMPEATVRGLTDGRVYSGRRAQELGLVDAIGGEREARAWLAETHAIPDTVPVRALETRSRIERLVAGGTESLAGAIMTQWSGQGALMAIAPR